MNFIEEEGHYRVFSFQSKDVIDNLLKTGIHKADISKSRERRDYLADIEQLGGESPIWGFTLPNELKTSNIYLGSLFVNFGCEMSVGTDGLNQFLMLELLIPKEIVRIGLTHNACNTAVVFPTIELTNIISISKVFNWEVINENGYDSFGYHIKEVYSGGGYSLFPKEFTTLSADDTFRKELDRKELLTENKSFKEKLSLPNKSDITKNVYIDNGEEYEYIGVVEKGKLVLNTTKPKSEISTNPLD